MSPPKKNPPPKKLRVLVVDDSPAQRSLICRHLQEFGFDYVEADSGKAALHIANTQAIDVILSDWMMPQMSGLDLCEKIRKAPQKASSKASPYVYFILLTVKSETLDIAKGLGAGADDFLIKPIAKIELNARLRAAARLLQMHTELQEKQTQTAQAFERLNCAYQVIETDLKEAGQLHRAMMPPSRAEYKNATVHTAFKSSQHLGGDVLGYFCIDENRLGFYGLDVCGHGVPSALLGVRLGSYFNPDNPARNIAFDADGAGYRLRDPAEVADLLNDLMLNMVESDLYFTLVYGTLDLETGAGRMVQAGSPHPVVFEVDSGVKVKILGTGGIPIGLVKHAGYESFAFDVKRGARVLIYSDGLVECENPKGVGLEEAGLIALIKRHRASVIDDFLPGLIKDVKKYRGRAGFEDDISALVIER